MAGFALTQAFTPMPAPPPCLSLEQICVRYPLAGGGHLSAVDKVSLSLEQGEILGLVGESGCGKSSLSRAIMQLQPLSAGRILLRGQDLSQLGARELRAKRLDFQMVFQDPYASLNPRLSIYSTLWEALNARPTHKKTNQAQRVEAVAELMARVGLAPEHMFKYPHEFSGGQRQRVAIARAIAPQPALLLADEPVSALDVSIQSQILMLLHKLRREMGLTMIFISHDLSVVRYMADKIAVMQKGRIVEYGNAEQIFEQAQSPYTQQLLAAIPPL